MHGPCRNEGNYAISASQNVLFKSKSSGLKRSAVSSSACGVVSWSKLLKCLLKIRYGRSPLILSGISEFQPYSFVGVLGLPRITNRFFRAFHEPFRRLCWNAVWKDSGNYIILFPFLSKLTITSKNSVNASWSTSFLASSFSKQNLHISFLISLLMLYKYTNIKIVIFWNISGTIVTIQNLIHEEIKRGLILGIACYHSVQKVLSPLLSKNIKITITNLYFSCGSVWMRNLVSDIKGGT
jgi:hypothetical protein